jgi:serine/threonine protein kinase
VDQIFRANFVKNRGGNFRFGMEIPDGVRRLNQADFDEPDTASLRQWGAVFAGVFKPTGEEVVIWRGGGPVPDPVPLFNNEIRALSELTHPSVIPLMGIIEGGGSSPEDIPKLVAKRAKNGSLDEIIQKEIMGIAVPGWNPTRKSQAVFGMIAGLAYCHSKGFIHHDFKPSHVYLDENFEPIISDFCLSKKLEPGALCDQRYLGSPMFMAPEITGESGGHDTKVDVYSYGMSLYMMFVPPTAISLDDGGGPLSNAMDLHRRIGRGAKWVRCGGIPDFYWDLISNCVDHEPAKRRSSQEVVDYLREHRSEYAFPRTDMAELGAYEKKVAPKPA